MTREAGVLYLCGTLVSYSCGSMHGVMSMQNRQCFRKSKKPAHSEERSLLESFSGAFSSCACLPKDAEAANIQVSDKMI